MSETSRSSRFLAVLLVFAPLCGCGTTLLRGRAADAMACPREQVSIHEFSDWWEAKGCGREAICYLTGDCSARRKPANMRFRDPADCGNDAIDEYNECSAISQSEGGRTPRALANRLVADRACEQRLDARRQQCAIATVAPPQPNQPEAPQPRTDQQRQSPAAGQGQGPCTLDQVLKMKDAGLTDAQIRSACQ